MPEKFDQANEEHVQAMIASPFSYFSLPLCLNENGFVLKRNEETILAAPNQNDPKDLQALFVPRNRANWENISIRFVTKDERDAIATDFEILYEQQTVTEFFYRTDDFENPTGDLAKKIRAFVSHNQFVVTHAYPKEHVAAFYREWEAQRDRDPETMEESERSFLSVLDRLDELGIRQVYVEIDGKLAGFAWGVAHPSGNWAGLHLKSLYRYRDLGRFLQHERAKLFPGTDRFTLGTSTSDKGVDAYKRELGPVETRPYYFLKIGDKKS